MSESTNNIQTFYKESSNIANKPLQYDTVNKTLTVTFKNPKTKIETGTYVYKKVPADLWETLKKAESLGSFVNQKVVKGGYDYEKL